MTAWFEDLPLDFTKDETRRAEELLISAYPINVEALILAQNAGLNLALFNQMAPIQFLMREMFSKARQSDRLTQLLGEVLLDRNKEAFHQELRSLIAGYEGTIAAAMMRRKPSLATLALMPSSLEVLIGKGTAPQPLAKPGLERMINAAAGFADPALFRLRLAEAEVRTARIDVGGWPKGSGFLIGDRLLLTNWHVVECGVQGAVAVFDNKVSPLGKGEQDRGRAVPFAADWLIASSAYAAVPLEVGAEGPPPGNWDFAVVRLAEPAGAQAIGSDPKAKDADQRGRYLLDGGPYQFNVAEPIFILGHPEGRPVQFSYASPSGAKCTQSLNRVRYKANTEGGSSGSPVFNRDWRVVALHHAAGPTSVPGKFNLRTDEFNQGIPISGIVNELKKQLAGRPELTELGLT